MTNYYKVLSGADVGGRAGVAYIRDFSGTNLLPRQGWVKDWETKYFSLRHGEYTDYLPVNIGCRLCSEKLYDLLERHKSKQDVLQWLDAEVESEKGERRQYYILHFPEPLDVLDKNSSKYSRGILTQHVIDSKACAGHEVISYVEGSIISFVISENMRNALKNAECRGLVYLKLSSKSESCIHKVAEKALQILRKKNSSQNVDIDERQDSRKVCLERLKELNLPEDLIDFILHHKKLSYDERKCVIGKIVLVPLGSLICGEIYVAPSSEEYKNGYYIVPVVDIILECEGFDAWGILVWLPDIEMFGSWDSDHRILRVFPNVRWCEIVKDPTKYLNALWEPQKVENTIFVPDGRYPFIKK